MIKDIFFRRLIITILMGFTLLVLWKLKVIILYVVLASLLSVSLSPVRKLIQKGLFIRNIKISNLIGTIVSLTLFFTLFTLFFKNIVPQIVSNLKGIDYMKLKTMGYFINEYWDHLMLDLGIGNEVENFINIHELLTNYIPKIINGILISLPKIFSGTLIVILISFFLLKSPGMFDNVITSSLSKNLSEKILASLSSIRKMIRKYIYGVVVQLSVIITLYSISMSIIGMKGAFTISFLVAMFNIIPYLGPIVGGVITLTFCIVTNLNMPYEELFTMTTYVAIAYSIIQLMDGMINQPIIFSKVVKAHPLEVFLLIISSSYLVGISGMIFAVPSYAVLRIIAREFLYKFKAVQFITKNINY